MMDEDEGGEDYHDVLHREMRHDHGDSLRKRYHIKRYHINIYLASI